MKAGASQVEREVVSTLWQSMETLLASGSADACRQYLQDALPHVDALSTADLPQLSKLHVSSASNLMATARLLAPTAFLNDSTSDQDNTSGLNLAALLSQDSGVLSMVSVLVDLQLFHLKRAAQLVAECRRRVRSQPRQSATTSAEGLSTNSTISAWRSSVLSKGSEQL